MSSDQTFKLDIPSLADKVILITGGTTGLGAGSVACLAQHSPAHIIFTGRNETAANALIARVNAQSPYTKLTFLRCDISSFASVRATAATILSSTPRLDILMLNAGIMATAPGLSADGYEIQFATNYLGHALLTQLLLPLLLSTAHTHAVTPRIVSMSSTAYTAAPSNGITYATLRTDQATLGGMFSLPRWARYGQSKLAQILHVRALAARHPELTCVAVHPGFVFTGLFDGLDFATKLPALVLSVGHTVPVEEGHTQQCWAATAVDGVESGRYYEPFGKLVTPKTKAARDEDGKGAEELWGWTERQFDER